MLLFSAFQALMVGLKCATVVIHPIYHNASVNCSKWRECSTIFEPKCGNSARMLGIVLRLSEKAAPEAAYFAPFL